MRVEIISICLIGLVRNLQLSTRVFYPKSSIDNSKSQPALTANAHQSTTDSKKKMRMYKKKTNKKTNSKTASKATQAAEDASIEDLVEKVENNLVNVENEIK